jgi:hypothetical protein
LAPRLRAEICRELDRIELVQRQLAAVEVEREKMLRSDQVKLDKLAGKAVAAAEGDWA